MSVPMVLLPVFVLVGLTFFLLFMRPGAPSVNAKSICSASWSQSSVDT